jgi:hypothetical protein
MSDHASRRRGAVAGRIEVVSEVFIETPSRVA